MFRVYSRDLFSIFFRLVRDNIHFINWKMASMLPDPASLSDTEEPGHRVVVPLSVASIDPSSDELFHVGTTGNKITIISGLEPFVGLKSVVLRSELIRRMTGIGHLINITHLELYDNQIARLEDLAM